MLRMKYEVKYELLDTHWCNFLFQGHSFKCRNDRYLTKNEEHFSKTEKNV